MKCPMIKKCGGCFYPQDQYQEELKEKTLFIEKEVQKAKLKIEVKPTVASPLVNGYRNKVIVAFNQKYEYGLYEEHSQDIIPYKHCLLHEDIMDEILQYIQSYLRKYRVSIYDRKRHKGLLRHVLIRRGVKTDQTMVVLVCNENMWRGSKQFCSQLVKRFPSIKTIVLNVNTRRTPIVLGNEDKVLYGKGFIVDELCGLKFKISPQSFYQINHDQCVNLYTKALSLLNIKGNETAIDAYCGIGTIGMILSQKVKQVIGVESNKDAIKDAKNNARMNQLSNIQFVCDDATEFMKKLAKERYKVDVVIMDPPRSGSTKQFMDSIKILNPKQVVYISCDPTTQIRDIQYFKKIGYHNVYQLNSDDLHYVAFDLTKASGKNKNLRKAVYYGINKKVLKNDMDAQDVYVGHYLSTTLMDNQDVYDLNKAKRAQSDANKSKIDFEVSGDVYSLLRYDALKKTLKKANLELSQGSSFASIQETYSTDRYEIEDKINDSYLKKDYQKQLKDTYQKNCLNVLKEFDNYILDEYLVLPLYTSTYYLAMSSDVNQEQVLDFMTN
jgi:23S rRNA (uracil1939-C5)-methyltransferase